MKIRTSAPALLAIAAVLAIAGCGSSSSNNNTSGGGEGAYGGAYAPPSKSETTSTGAANVSLGSVSKLGMVLVESKGMTLYGFQLDKEGMSACNGACAESWPPLLTSGEPTAGNGSKASLLGTTKRSDGTTQVTYAGHPLYTFVGDSGPGEANGNGSTAFGGKWFALNASGMEP